MARQLLLLFALFAVPASLLAQGVGINNPTPDASALLDLSSTDKGLLVPRMNTASRLGIPVPAQGLLVYDITENVFYYFDGLQWRPLSGSDTAWRLNGNSGTSPITDFIGTADLQPLSIRTLGVERLHITTTGALIATGDPVAFPPVPPTTEQRRMMWLPALYAFRAGQANTAWNNGSVGEGSAAFGNENTASGEGSFATGSNNVALGNGSVALGNNNIVDNGSFAFGNNNIAGVNSAVLGTTNNVNGNDHSVLGHNNQVQSNDRSVVLGSDNVVSGGTGGAFALGRGIQLGSNNVGLGRDITLGATGSMALGSGISPGFGQLTTFQQNTLIMGIGSDRATFALAPGQFGEPGRAGIATDIPLARLHIVKENSTDVTSSLLITDGILAPALHVRDDNRVGINTTLLPATLNVQGNNTFNNAEQVLQVTPGFGDPALVVTELGRTGVGVNEPASDLHLRGQEGFLLTNDLVGNTATDGVRLGMDASGDAQLTNQENSLLQLRSGGLASLLQLDGSTGNVSVPFNNLGVGTDNPTNRLHVQGSVRIEDGNQAPGRVLVSDVNGIGTWTDLGATLAGSLDASYNFGGPGAGRVINANDGAVRIDGTDGFVSTGILNSGAIPETGAGVRMMWYPRKAAFRAGRVLGTEWDDISIGQHSMAWGLSSRASGPEATAWGASSHASGAESTAWGGLSLASGNRATAWGRATHASGTRSTAWGDENFASGTNSTAWGAANSASSFNASAWGILNSATNNQATAWGDGNIASGLNSSAWGIGNRAPSIAETAFGAYCTEYTPVSNDTDRLLVIGNGSGPNAANRRNALLILRNGNTTIGNANPNTRLDVVAGATGTATRVMTVRSAFNTNNTGTGIALINSTNNASNVGSEIVSVTTNATTGLSDLRFLVHGGGGANGALNERLRILGNGNVGIGVIAPSQRLHVDGNIRMVDGNQAAGRVLVSSADGTGTWTALSPAQTNAWSLNGNAITAAHVLGSTNNVSLKFLVNNNTAGEVSNAGLRTFLGYLAGENNTGTSNTFIGYFSGRANTTGANNTFVGVGAGENNDDASEGTFVGRSAGIANESGTRNTFIGRSAGSLNIAGSQNTVLGWGAGNAANGYAACTFVGYDADGNNTTSRSNSMALGHNSRINGDNMVRVGNGAITSIGGFADWTNLPSDARFKKNVAEDINGLDFILRLRPVSYNVDVWQIAEHLQEDTRINEQGQRVPGEVSAELAAARDAKARERQVGFIAQEVDEAARAIGFDFSGIDRSRETDEMLGLRYASFVVPLVKAVQEQQAEIEAQRTLIQRQEERAQDQNETIARLAAELEALRQLVQGPTSTQR